VKRLVALVSAAMFFGASIVVPTHAAVTAGAKCATKGQIKISQGRKYTCTKSGKKLVWNKGIVVAPTIPNVNPTPTPTPTVTAKAIANSWPLDKAIESVENLLSIADASERRYLADLEPVDVALDIRLGPTTSKVRAEEFLAPLKAAVNNWSGDFAPKESVVIAIAEVQDYEFMKEIWPKFGLNGGGFDNSQEGWARYGSACNQGSAIYDQVPFFWGCMSTSGSLEMIGLRKFTAHEYTHLVQYGIIRKKAGKSFSSLPLIFMEGAADYYGITYSSTPEKFLKDWASYRSIGFLSNETKIALKNANSADMQEMISDSMSGGKKFSGHWYYTGAYATARLIAAQGHKGYVDYMYEYGLSGDAYAAFEKVYGVKFENFAKIIAPELVEFAKLLS
jgi:hypothetical protein